MRPVQQHVLDVDPVCADDAYLSRTGRSTRARAQTCRARRQASRTTCRGRREAGRPCRQSAATRGRGRAGTSGGRARTSTTCAVRCRSRRHVGRPSTTLQWAALATGRVVGVVVARRRRRPRSWRCVAAPGTAWRFRRRHAPAYIGVRVRVHRRPPTSANAARLALPGSVIGCARALSPGTSRRVNRCRCVRAAGRVAPFGAVAMPTPPGQCNKAKRDRPRYRPTRFTSLGRRRGRRQGRRRAQSHVRGDMGADCARSGDATRMRHTWSDAA